MDFEEFCAMLLVFLGEITLYVVLPMALIYVLVKLT